MQLGLHRARIIETSFLVRELDLLTMEEAGWCGWPRLKQSRVGLGIEFSFRTSSLKALPILKILLIFMIERISLLLRFRPPLHASVQRFRMVNAS